MNNTDDSGINYTFTEACEVCGAKPVIKGNGMCSVCNFGEADSMWEWLDEKWVGKERKLAQKYAMSILTDIELVDLDGKVDPIKAVLLHIDQHVLDKIEKLL